MNLISENLTLSEDVLVKRFRAGNGAAFKEIFDLYYLPLKSYAYHFVMDDEVIEDFVQDAFLAVWEKREHFFFVAAMKSFLYTSVRNASLDYLRHQKVRREHEPGLVLWLTEEGEEEFLLEEEVHAMVYEAVKDLSEQARRVVMMTMDGDSNPEIAEQLGISVNTVKTLKLRAYRVLRENLKGLQWLLLLLFDV